MHNIDLIITLTSCLTVALVAGYVTQRIGLSPIVGYLLGGIMIGPFTPGLVADMGIAEQLAEIGIILLMFGVGLQFHLEELLAVRRIAIPGALAQGGLATLAGSFAAHAFGWAWPAAIVFGLSLSVASTVVLVRVLSDRRQLHTQAGHIAVGWLVVQDVLTVIVLVLLPALKLEFTLTALATSVFITLLKVGGLIAVAAIFGRRVIPVILDRIAATRS